MAMILKALLEGVLITLNIIRSPLYWIVILLVTIQYRRIYKMRKKVLGVGKEPIYLSVIKASVLGLIGGMLGSMIILVLGVVINPQDFKYLFTLAIVLMLIHPRFICFSYSGGIISILSLTIGYPRINVSSIMAIVAILHLIESFLILIDGDSNKLPIFIERNNNIIGAFNMVRFWPIPFVVLMLANTAKGELGIASIPWWKIFRASNLGSVYSSIPFLMAGVIAALGYGDIAITDYPRNKAKKTSRNLLIYSCILLVLAITSTYIHIFKFFAALFSSIAHEIIIIIGRKREQKGKPIFTPVKRGIKILDILPKSFAQRMGLRTGDIILSINGFNVNTKEDVNQILSYSPKYVLIEYIDIFGKSVVKELREPKKGINSLGILSVPQNPEIVLTATEVKSPILVLIRKIKGLVA